MATEVSFVELEFPLPANGAAPSSVASRAAIGLADVQWATRPVGVTSRAAIGQPSLPSGPPAFPVGVESRAAVATPTVVTEGVITGGGTITAEVAANLSVAGVTSRRAIGTPAATSTLPVNPVNVTINASGVASRATVGSPLVSLFGVVSLDGRGIASRAAVGSPTVTSTGIVASIAASSVLSRRAVGGPAITQVGGEVLGAGGPDDDDTVGPHRVPRHLRKKKLAEDPATVEAQQRAKEAEAAPVETKTIQPEPAPFPRRTEEGVLVTPAMLEQIKQEAMRAARLAVEARQLKEGRLVAAARDYADQKAQQRVETLAELAIRAAEEAEYEPAEREQVKEVEIEDPTTGKPFKATIRTKVSA